MTNTDTQNVGVIVNRIINRLESQEAKGHPDTAVLAAFRNSAGKSIEEAQDVWPILFETVPSSYLSVNGKPTYQENAIFVALQLYSLAMQGSNRNVRSDPAYLFNIGRSLSAGRSADNSRALDRRFNAMTAADDFSALNYHLRQIFKLVKSRNQMTINYGKLATDLYWYQVGMRDRVCFHWAEEYYGRFADADQKTDTANAQNYTREENNHA